MITRKGGDCGELQSTSSNRASQTLPSKQHQKGFIKVAAQFLTQKPWSGILSMCPFKIAGDADLLVQGPHFENSWSKVSNFTLQVIAEIKKGRQIQKNRRFFKQGWVFPILFQYVNQTETVKRNSVQPLKGDMCLNFIVQGPKQSIKPHFPPGKQNTI